MENQKKKLLKNVLKLKFYFIYSKLTLKFFEKYLKYIDNINSK
jgi:hypothetical protein